MADLSFTVTDCVPTSTTILQSGFRGILATAGEAVYFESATNTWKTADNNAATEEARRATGIAVNTGRTGHPITVARGGAITVGSGILTPGAAYYLSDTLGGICPYADIGAGEYVCLIGIAESTTILHLNFLYSGVSL